MGTGREDYQYSKGGNPKEDVRSSVLSSHDYSKLQGNLAGIISGDLFESWRCVIEANPQGLIQWNPPSMAKYGKIDEGYGGGNVFRLIWAPSRKVTLMLDCGPVTLEYYAAIEQISAGRMKNHAVWVMEKWLGPEALTTATPEEWNSNPELLMQGPYPANGDYCMAALPLTCDPASANIDKLVAWIEGGKGFTPQQHAIALQNEVDGKERDKDRIRRDMIEDRLLPFGAEAMVGGGSGSNGKTGRGTKIIGTTRRSANELGLPTKPGLHPGLSVRPTTHYQVPIKD